MKIVLFFILTSFITLMLFVNSSYAQESNNTQVSEIQNKINDLQAKISELQGQKNTLSSQIGVMDNQINLTELKIQSVEAQIAELSLDIDTADNKIDKLDNSLNKLSGVLINRIRETYIVGRASSFQILISSTSIDDYVKKANYLKIVQSNDKRLIYDTVQARNDYATQKKIFRDKKTSNEQLQNELETYKTQLASEKIEKDNLLKITQNDEAVYQEELQRALAEQRAILDITSGAGSEISLGSINQGEVIGSYISGASTCSSGSHLHFEVKKDGSHINPSNYLIGKSVIWNNNPDGQFDFSGSWEWPIDDQISINQGYGFTAWSNVYYSGGPHTGLDIHSTSSRNVKAVKNGELFKGSIACGSGQLKFARIDHKDGTQSYYLHID